MNAEPRVLQARSVLKTYRDGDTETRVLKGIDLDLATGELTALMGQSGSGKSTLLSILGTLLKPSGGEIEIAGRSLAAMRETEVTAFRNRTIGFVFQFHHLMPDFTAFENVLFPTFPIRGGPTAAHRQRARDLLDRVGLTDRRDYRSTKLSGGQKQRVAVARALMNRPRLVLADEPTGNLDQDSSRQLIDLLQELAEQERTTLLISTHDSDLARRCDRTLHIVDGRIVD